MKQARLLTVGVLSLLLHLLAASLIARRIEPTAGVSLPSPPVPTTVRLHVVRQLAPPDAHDTPPAAAAPPAPRPSTMAGARAGAAPQAPMPTTGERLRDAPLMAPLAGQAAAEQMPSRYRAMMPPAAVLHFTVTRPGAPPQPATLAWETNGYDYTVRSDGVSGKLWAQGVVGDAGVAPKTSGEAGADGSSRTTEFSVDTIVIGGREFANSVGSQDRASLLLQLVGMGLAEPDQVRGDIAIYVAGPDKAEIMRFEVIEDEEIATPLGNLTTRHLVQQVRADQPRLDIWLAPAWRWLPVQIRSTAPDGAVATQTMTGIEGR